MIKRNYHTHTKRCGHAIGDDEEYVVLLPVSDEGEEDEGEVVILKLEDTDEDSEEESYVGVEDEEILNKVFAIFKEKYKDEFNFVDED